jgi:predicted metal-dependent hydrolase
LNFPGKELRRYQISHQDQVIEYEVVHRPRVTRCIHLELAEHGALQVVAPRRMSKRLIQSTMQEWADYVARFLLAERTRLKDIPVFRYVSGERHLFMGRAYPLEILESAGRRTGVELADGKIQVRVTARDPENARAALVSWYRRQAGLHFSARMAAISQAAPWTTAKKPALRLRLMKRAWGTCSAKGVITLNPHLVKAPPECIDYVVAHEICHLKEHNHSRAFYDLQDRLYPGWRAAKAELGKCGHIYLESRVATRPGEPGHP